MIRVISLGGASGYDAEAIQHVLTEEGLCVTRPQVVDPNGLAAYLSSSRDQVDFFAVTVEEFFSKYFTRDQTSLYIFHLGNILNVLSEEVASKAVSTVAEYSQSEDMISLLVIEKMHFTKGSIVQKELEILEETSDEGLTRVVYKDSRQHYKTLIGDREKFSRFMASLGVLGYFEEFLVGGVRFLSFMGRKI